MPDVTCVKKIVERVKSGDGICMTQKSEDQKKSFDVILLTVSYFCTEKCQFSVQKIHVVIILLRLRVANCIQSFQDFLFFPGLFKFLWIFDSIPSVQLILNNFCCVYILFFFWKSDSEVIVHLHLSSLTLDFIQCFPPCFLHNFNFNSSWLQLQF